MITSEVSDKGAASAPDRGLARGFRSYPLPIPLLPLFLAGTLRSWSPCCGNGPPRGLRGLPGLVKSRLLAVPGLASLLTDCVQSNPTLEWAGPTFEPPPPPSPPDLA